MCVLAPTALMASPGHTAPSLIQYISAELNHTEISLSLSLFIHQSRNTLSIFFFFFVYIGVTNTSYPMKMQKPQETQKAAGVT